MVGVAVKITEVPSQIAPVGDGAMLTEAATLALTVMVIPFDVAGLPVAHPSLEVRTHVTTWVLVSELVV